MDWVKLSTGYYNDRKVRRLPDADTEVMFVRSLAYVGGEETCGFIPEDDVQLLSRRRRYDSCVDALVAAGLWIQEEGGYRLPPDAWERWNGDLDVLAGRRRADRERKRRVRRAAASADMSADISPETTESPRTKRERERETERGGTSREVPPAARDPGQPPPETCDRHPNGTDDPCRACQRRREAYQQWQRDQAAATVERRRSAPRCARHRGQPAHNCASCRADRLAAA